MTPRGLILHPYKSINCVPVTEPLVFSGCEIKAKADPQIRCQLSALDDATERLLKVTHGLADRLDPVLMPSPANAAERPPQAMPAISPLGDIIRSDVVRVLEAVGRIEAILGRLEI